MCNIQHFVAIHWKSKKTFVILQDLSGNDEIRCIGKGLLLAAKKYNCLRMYLHWSVCFAEPVQNLTSILVDEHDETRIKWLPPKEVEGCTVLGYKICNFNEGGYLDCRHLMPDDQSLIVTGVETCAEASRAVTVH